jgi:polyisoprenyl-teichoic acid--peptidoglycan teichoic acid transferase
MSSGQPPLPTDESPPTDPKKSRSLRQRLLLGGGVGLVAVILVAVVGVGYVWYRYNQIGREDLNLDAAVANEPQNYLIVGSDSRDVVDETDPDAKAFLGGNAEPAGKRSDTIMIARVDPTNNTIDTVSFPRDLWVAISGTGSNERINTAYGVNDGPQRLIDTLRQDFGITINHYVELDFKSFKGIVDAVGGVPMSFQTPMRDRNSGLYVDTAGCTTLDGDQALAFARSRHLEYMDSKLKWVSDPSADLGRINRQQVFLQHVIDQAATKTKGFDLKRMNDLLSSTADNLKVDTSLDLGQMVKLARRFSDFHGDQLRTHTLPVYPYETAGGASVLKLDETAAAPVFDVFRGLTPGDAVPPPDIRLAIENGSGVSGQAGEAQQAFESIGFSVERTSTATATQTATIVRYAPGSDVVAQNVAGHLPPTAQLQEDATLAADQVLVITGKDFKNVMDNGQPVVASGSTTSSKSSTTSIPKELEYTEPVGIVPEGDC